MVGRWSATLAGEEDVVEEILKIGRERSPAEACGLLMPEEPKVVELRNSSEEPEDSCIVEREEIERGLQLWWTWRSERGLELPEDPGQVGLVLWHTHPGGSVGPSRLDLRHRCGPPGSSLVVALPDGPAVRY